VLEISPTETFRVLRPPDSESEVPRTPDPLTAALAETLKVYRRSLRELLAGRFSGIRDQLPRYLRGECRILAIACLDGLLLRHDPTDEEKSSIFCARTTETMERVAPTISNGVLHVPTHPETYVVPPDGVSMQLSKTDRTTGTSTPLAVHNPKVLVHRRLDASSVAALTRPTAMASALNEIEILLEGERIFADPGPHPDNRFVVRTRLRIAVPWCAVEVYPLTPPSLWNPSLAAAWAEIDLLTTIAAQNVKDQGFHAIDGRAGLRRTYADLLAEFQALLDGPEEPVHQFLRRTPHLLCPSYERCLSKVKFGDTVSDFVLLDPREGYILVEIEAPTRPIMRQDGHPRAELSHAVHQVLDWIRFVQENRATVEESLDLRGISPTPRGLVVIGRSDSLSEDDRRFIATMETMTPRLRIMTYDDVLRSAKIALENLFGPLDSWGGSNTEVYYYSGPSEVMGRDA
jgi:hypothetical protein